MTAAIRIQLALPQLTAARSFPFLAVRLPCLSAEQLLLANG